ncbi:MAG: GNAT family protein [Phycisphaerales bacterium]
MSARRPKACTESAALVRGRRLYLRYLHPADEREWIDLRLQSREHLTPWDPVPPPGQDLYGATGFQRHLETSDTELNQRHLVVRRADEAIVGMVNLSQICRGPFDNAIMGYWIGFPHITRGFGVEGVTLCLRRAFGELGLHRVEANIMPSNAASLALVRRVGFRFEGISPRYLQIAGQWEDHTRWAITREDFKRPRA